MKKLTKLLILVLSLALICGIFAVAAFAEEAGEGSESTEITTGWVYTTDGTTYTHSESLSDAISGAKDGTTIIMAADTEITLTASIGISKDLTIDLNGKTLALVQQGQYALAPGGSYNVTFKNGTIVAASGEKYNGGKNQTNKDTYAIFQPETNAILNVENVNTYGYAIAFAHANPYTINVDGGEHHMYTSYANLTSPGFICGNHNIVASVENATIYLESTEARLLGFQNYKTTADKAKSSATFTNCNIIATEITYNILPTLNKYGKVTFVGCDIFGKVAPGATALDTAANQSTFDDTSKNPVEGAVTIGAGCRISSGTIGNNIVKWADGITPASIVDAEVIATKTPSGYYSNGDFALTSTYKGAVFTVADPTYLGTAETKFLTENNDCVFTITAGDKTYYTNSIFDALTLAPTGATVTLNKDYEFTKTGALGTITKGITIDLNGHILSIAQSTYASFINVATEDKVTLKNGTLVACVDNILITQLAADGDGSWKNSDGTPKITRALDGGLPLFVAGAKTDIEINDVNLCVATILHNESYSGAKLVVNGGIVQSTMSSIKSAVHTFVENGLITARANVDVTFNNVGIYLNYCSSLLAVSHAKETGTKCTTITYNGGNIYLYATDTQDNKRLIKAANEKTTVTFNGTAIYGYIGTPTNKDSGLGAFTSANLIFGEGTRHGQNAKQTTLSMTPTLANSSMMQFTATSYAKVTGNVKEVTENGTFHIDADSSGYSDGYAKLFMSKDLKKEGACTVMYGTPAFELVKDGETIQRPYNSGYTLYTAISDADAGTTVKLLKGYTIETASSVASIAKELTLDLSGYTITVVQENQNAYFNVNANVTIKNGTLVAGANDSYTNIANNKNITDPHNYAAPLFRTNTVCDLVFENITFYGSTVVYNYGQRAETVKVFFNNFNYYGMYYQADATAPALVDSRGNIAVTVTNSNLYLVKASLLSSLHNKVTGSDTVKKSTFDFINTKIYSPDTSKSLIANASNRTFVTFTNCDIIGRFSPSLNNWDKNAGDNVNGVVSAAMPATNITFKEGCRWGYTGTSALIPTYANGVAYYGDTTSSNSYYPSNGCFIRYQDGIFGDADDVFAIPTTATAVTATYQYSSSLVEGVTYQYKVTKGSQTIYLPDTYTLNEAITLADADSDVTDDVATLVLLKDLEHLMTSDINPGKNITIDLNGYTLYIEQYPNSDNNGARSFVTSKSLKFVNGTIMMAASASYGSNKANNAVNAIVQPGSGAKIYFKNVNTYGGAITYSWGNSYTVYVDGGVHYVYQSHANITYAGWICGNDNITAEVKNATIYLDHKGVYLVGFQNYKVDSGVTPKSSAYFYNCTIVDNESSNGMIHGLNKYSTVTFEKCDIFGKIAPGATSNDAEADKNPVAGSITIGAGCRFTNDTIGNSAVAVASGVKLAGCAFTEELSVKAANGLWNTDGFTLTSSTVTVTYTICDATLVAGDVENSFSVIVNGEVIGAYADLASAIEAATAGATIKLLSDVTIDAYGLIATIDKAITIDLDGKHLQIVQHMANSQIIINTTAPVTITNGRISCAADAVYRKTLTTTSSPYDVGEPIFVSTSVAVDFTLNGISTYSAGLFYNTVSGSKFTVIGGYHKQISITYPNLTYLERALIVSKANITVLFQNASIDMDWCGSLLVSTAQNESSYDNARSTFTYENCQVYYTGNDNQIIRVANDKTFVYFKGSDVYGAFVRPTKKDGSNFTSANLHFDANTTWYNVNPAGKTLVTPTLPEGYVFVPAADSAAKISFTKYAITGQIHAGTLIFPATSTTGSFTVDCVVAVKGNAPAYITVRNHVIYCLENATLADIVKTAMSYDGAVVTFLTDITFQPTGYMNITKNVTFDLNGHVLTLIHDGQDKTFQISEAVTAKFENGTIITTPGASYAKNNSTFCFVYVSKNNANLVFDGVSGRVTTLVYAWGASYTITVNDGTFVLDTVAGGMNTSGFISGQANITATVNNTTLFVENSYILGASSYKQFANLNGTTNTIESVKEAIKSTFTFNNCNIIGNNVNKNLISNANEFTTVTFNGGTIYGNISPIKNASDGTLKYIQIGNKFYVNPTACTCATFIDTNGDGKCDNVVGESACGKFDPASIKSFTFAESTNANFIIGKGTYFSASTNIKVKTTLADKLIAQNIAKNITIGGINYSFDYVTDYVYVIWHDANGNELNKVPVDGNFTGIVAPEYTVPTTGANNGWYQIGGFVQGGWTTTFGGTTAVDFSTITDFSANLNFYPQASGGITAYLSAAMYNLSIVGQIRNNFYIPVDMPENVKILGVYIVDENGNKIKDVSGTEILFKDHRNEPVYYTMYVINYVDAIALTESTRVWVDYTVNDITLTQKYTISPEKYVNTVYADYVNETEQYNDAAYNVVADLVRYSYFISVYANAESAAITDLYSKMMALCSKLPTDMTPDASVDTSNLAGLGTIAFEASQFNPRWKFTLNESAQIVDIKITLQGYNAGFLNDRTNFGTQTYGITSVTKVNGYITSAYTVNIPVYNLIQPFTITMTKADGTEISAIFDLNSYYQSVKGTAAAADFLESVVALANSTIAYKFPDGKVTVNDIADFWECDHPADMVNKLDEYVAYTNVFKPHYCQKCDSYLFYYEDYGAVADGVTAHKRATHISGTNNYEAIYWTHANANEWKARTDLSGGKHVAVIGNTNPTVAKNYYISLPEGIGLYKIDTNLDGVVDTVYKNGQNLGSIIVATDTSWNGVNLLIDDDTICNNYASNYDSKDPNKPTEPCDCGRKHAYVDQPIFILDEYASEKIEQNWKGKLTSLSAGATNIGFAPGRDMLVHLVDADKKIYLRYGANASNGNAISEVILVHADGSIDPSTPVQWDYTNLNNQDSDKVMAYAADAEEIKISGLDANGQINAIFETYVNNDVKQYLYHYEQTARNITIRRSNATVEGLDRIFLEEAADNANNTNDRMAYTFIKVELCSDVTIKDMLVMNHNSQAGDTGTSQGSYEFSAGNANAVKWINCDTKNMFSAGKDGSLLAYPVYRGLFGTNHTRNMYLADCFLNSFDAHTGAYNVTIERSTFDHMNFIGGGLIKLTDVTVYTASNYGSAINLRKDYGSTWNGDLEIDGLTVRYGLGDKPERITLIYGSYVNQYWGFDTYMPQNVTINNFHVESYTATVEDTNGDNVMDKRIERSAEYTITYEDIDFDGVMDKRTEDLEAKNNESYGKIDGNIYVYYYYGAGDKDGYDKSVSAGHIHNLSASKVPAASAAGKHGPEDKGDSSIKYDYGTNHLECTKNLTITNSVEFNLPTGDFWKNMNFSMNGSKYVWTEKKIGNYVISAKFEKQ